MGNEGSAVLWNGVPHANTSLRQREPAWGYYSQVSVVHPLAYSAAGPRNDARASHPTTTRVHDALPASGTTSVAERAAIAVPSSERDGGKQWGPWSLTQRELDVLQLLAEGATNSEISERLFISPKTTKNHLAAIFQKLDVTNRTHALVRAVVMGLVTIE
jgi:DNA-binding CsgD family transcriptional regulator